MSIKLFFIISIVCWVILLIIFFIIFRINKIFYIKLRLKQFIPKINLFKTTLILSDKYEVSYEKEIIKDSKYIFLCIHGMGYGKFLFWNFKNYSKKHKISFFSFDQRCFGTNAKYKIKNIGTLLNDILEVINFLKHNYKDKKIILVGISLGAALIAFLSGKYNNLVEKIILINFATNLNLSSDNKEKKLLKNFFKSFKFYFYLLVGFFFFKSKKLPMSESSKWFFTDGWNNYLKYVNNDLKLFNEIQYINQSFIYLIHVFFLFINIKYFLTSTTNNKILILQSKEDVYYNEKNFNQILKRIDKYNKINIDINIYNEGKHDLINEDHFEEIFLDILKFIKK